MISALEPLTELPGVKLVMLVTADGVPIAVPGRQVSADDHGSDDPQGGPDPMGGLGREDALAAVATSWTREIKHAVGQISWGEPSRIVLKGMRGTLVLQQTKNAALVVILSRGMAPEEVRLAMDGTIARIERSVSGRKRGRDSSRAPASQAQEAVPGPVPTESEAASSEEAEVDSIELGDSTKN